MAKAREGRIVLIRHPKVQGYVLPLPENAVNSLPSHRHDRDYTPCRIFKPDPRSPVWTQQDILITGDPFYIRTSIESDGDAAGFLTMHRKHVLEAPPWAEGTIDKLVRASGQRVSGFNGLLVAEHAQYRAGDVEGRVFEHWRVSLVSLAVPVDVPYKRK